MITEKRTLKVGVGHGGKIHRELEIRPRLVKDLVAASSSDLVAQDKNAYEVCCLAGQIVKLGEIPKEAITGELLMEMHADDFDVLTDAAEAVRQRAAGFCGEPGGLQKDDSGAA
jgi:hypothetical protein